MIAVLFLALQTILIVLLIIWWIRWSPQGLWWAVASLFLAIGLSYFSGVLFQVPPYQVGCEGFCAGWKGFPWPTHHIQPDTKLLFDGPSFVRNGFFYYAVLLAVSAFIAWLASWFRWSQRSWKQRIFFIFIVIVLPLATLPMWIAPPQPQLSKPDQRLVINAARDWRWQLHLRGWMDRRLALEDLRASPNGEGQRVCFRIYTWFYLPYQRAYIDLDTAGVLAIKGGEIPLSQSCWTQP